MKIGIQTVVYPGFVPLLDQARQIEAAGFHSFFHGEHHHYPESTPVPEFYKETGVPGFYRKVLDPLMVLSAVSVAAPRLTVGTGIVLLPIHDTLTLANRIVTLDDLTEGKTLFCFGVGWNRPEIEHHGVDFGRRVEKAHEQLKAMRHMWSHQPSSFHGEWVNYDNSTVPHPVQKPWPPLIYGGRMLPKNLRLLAEVADGWNTTDMYDRAFGGQLERDLATLANAVSEQGRDPAKLVNCYLYADLMIVDHDPASFAAAAPSRADLERLERLGFSHVIIGAPAFRQDHFTAALDHIAGVAEPWL